jgi:CheY-like chemotaxis protein
MKPTVRDGESVNILVVEDEFLIAEWIGEVLSDCGFHVATASNARDALRHLASARVDVLFTDINLPGTMDGLALAREARALLPRLPVIYASARVAAPGPETRVPGAVFVRKPYEPEAVGRLIAAAARSAALVPA